MLNLVYGSIAPKRHTHLDFVKTYSIFLVVYWHIQPVDFVYSGNALWFYVLDRTNSLILYEISLIAVPSFFLSSLYLLSDRFNKNGKYIKKRLVRIFSLYTLWSVVQYGIYLYIYGKLPALKFSLIENGGPPLRHVGGSVFYFLFDLFFLTLLYFLFEQLGKQTKKCVSIISVSASFLFFELGILFPELQLGHVNLFNFVYLIPDQSKVFHVSSKL